VLDSPSGDRFGNISVAKPESPLAVSS